MSLINQPPQSRLQTKALLTGQVGGGTTGKVYQRDSDMSGDDVAYQRSRNSGSEICFPNLSQGSNLSSYLNGQSGTFDLPKKTGDAKNKKLTKIAKRDLGNFTFEYDHDYCGVSCQYPKQMSRSEVSMPGRRFRMDSVQGRLSSLCLKLGIPKKDLFASRVSH